MATKSKLRTSLKKLFKSKQKKVEIPVGKKNIRDNNKNLFSMRFPFTNSDNILLVGEGNFSFTLAICNVLHADKYEGQIFATTLDSKEISVRKYPDCEEILAELEKFPRVTLFFSIDGTNFSKKFATQLPKITTVVFNFPHVGMGIKNQDRNLMANQKLVHDFFKNINALFPQAKIMLTIKGGEHYEKWNVKLLAKEFGYECIKNTLFNPGLFPGYSHRRTIGAEANISKLENQEILGSRSLFFSKCTVEKKIKATKIESYSDDSD